VLGNLSNPHNILTMPDYDTHIQRGHPILFGLILFFAIIEACDTTFLVARFNQHNNYPNRSYRDRLKFLVFVSWWTVAFSAMYLAVFLTAASSFIASIASHGIWMAITWIFWLAAIASYTAALGGGKRCDVDTITFCSQLVAAEAFGWIVWIIFTIAFILIVVLGVGALRRGDRLSGGLIA